MKEFFQQFFKVFLIDFAIFVVLFIITYLLSLLKPSNKKEPKKSKGFDSLKRYFSILSKHRSGISKTLIIFMIVHVCVHMFRFYNDDVHKIMHNNKYPFFNWLFKIMSPIIKELLHYLIPIIIIISVIILLYGISKTVSQITTSEFQNLRMLSIVSDNAKDTVTNSKADDSSDSKNKKNVKVSKKEGFFYLFNNIQDGFFKFAKLIPILALVIFSCIGINDIFIIVNQRIQIKEYTKVVQHLSNNKKSAKITLIDNNGMSDNPEKTYRIQFFDSKEKTVSKQSQDITVHGDRLYIDYINVNFEYSEIGSGKAYNIAYPYRVYTNSNKIEDDAVELMFYDEKNQKSYPLMYYLTNNEIYGMDETLFFKDLCNLFEIIKDKEKSREIGIKSTLGEAPEILLNNIGDVVDLYIQGTGGISVNYLLTTDDDFSEDSDKNNTDKQTENNDSSEELDNSEAPEEKQGFFSKMFHKD